MCECLSGDVCAHVKQSDDDFKLTYFHKPQTRRGFLKFTACGTALLGGSPLLAKAALDQERVVSIYNPNTTEALRLVYWIPGEGYIQEALQEFSYTMRDHRNDDVIRFDPHLLDQIYALSLQLNYRKPVHLLSGYRSPQTNAMLRRQSKRVARDSYHTKGQASDVRMPGLNVGDLHRAAVMLKAGGVGYYPRQRFIHVDTGDVRYWG